MGSRDKLTNTPTTLRMKSFVIIVFLNIALARPDHGVVHPGAHHSVHHAAHQVVHHQPAVHHTVHQVHQPMVHHAVHHHQPVVPVEVKEAPKTIAELVVSEPRFSTLLAAVKAADLVDTLSGEGPFTVFAPTNEAFAKVPEDALAGLLADKDALTKVLLRHVVPGTKFAKGLQLPTYLQTAGGAAEDRIGTVMFRSGTVKVFSAPDGKKNV